MAKLEIKKPEVRPRLVAFIDMKEGDIGRIVSGSYAGQIVMRRYDKVFSLGPDNLYWGTTSQTVELLEPGTRVVLTVE